MPALGQANTSGGKLAIHLGEKACDVVLVGDVGEGSRNVRRGGQTFVEHALRYVTYVDARTIWQTLRRSRGQYRLRGDEDALSGLCTNRSGVSAVPPLIGSGGRGVPEQRRARRAQR